MSRPDDVEGTLGDAFDDEEEGLDEEPSFFDDPKRLLQTLVAVTVLLAGIYFLFPKLVGVEDGIRKLGSGDAVWLLVAFAFTFAMFAAYVALFKGIVGGDALDLTWGESYEINMAGLAATRLFSAGGAGGIVLTYWALRKAGMPRRQSAARMVAFLVLLYAIYMFTLVINGILLRTGVFAGQNPAGLTVVPAAVAGGVILLFLLVAMVPADLQRRLAASSSETRFGRLRVKLATVPATVSTGVRTAIMILRSPRRGWLAIAGAIGFWAANIAILWASFKAFDVSIAGAVVVQGFFIGMVANLIPGVPGGVGAVDAGMIGAFVLFGVAGDSVFAAVLCYRLFAFWLPLPPGIIAFFQLRRTISRWEQEGSPRSRVEGAAQNRQEQELGIAPATVATRSNIAREGETH
jgi:uncharacterized protein (TIRG00374 family)